MEIVDFIEIVLHVAVIGSFFYVLQKKQDDIEMLLKQVDRLIDMFNRIEQDLDEEDDK